MNIDLQRSKCISKKHQNVLAIFEKYIDVLYYFFNNNNNNVISKNYQNEFTLLKRSVGHRLRHVISGFYVTSSI